MRATATFRRVAVRSCHHSGKTWTAAALVHWFLRAFDPSLVITTAPTDRQVKEVLWNEIGILQRNSGLPGNLLTTSLEVSPTQRAFGFTTTTPERFQGWHCENILVVVDEASGVPEPIYEAIEGCLTGPNAHELLIGNPNNASGTFYEAFRSDLYQKFHISAEEVPEQLLPGAWAEERRREWGEDSPVYQVRVLGKFPVQGVDNLFSLADVEAAQERECPEGKPLEMGVDVARYGDAETFVYVRKGGAVVYAEGWKGKDTVWTTGRVMEIARRFPGVLVKVDDIGIGGGVLDPLLANKVHAVGVNVGEAASDPEYYANRRAEVYMGLAQRFKDGDISIPKDDMLLVDQLCAIKKGYTTRGQMKLPTKDDFRKERSVTAKWRSPDRADALAICFAPPGRGYRPSAAAGPGRPMPRVVK